MIFQLFCWNIDPFRNRIAQLEVMFSLRATAASNAKPVSNGRLKDMKKDAGSDSCRACGAFGRVGETGGY